MANKYSDIDLSKYNNGYQASAAVKQAQLQKAQAENAVSGYGPFNYANQSAYDQAIKNILNRKDFTYDLNGDALYQQYKDNYIQQGKQAMMDTMGQAAAMTGGYGNSYAATVGNQAYQSYLTQLNNMVPQLYQLALDKYNADGDRLNDAFSVLSADRQTAYGEYADAYDRLVNDRAYYSDAYDSAYSRDYSAWSDQRDYDQQQYWNEYNAGYQAERDAVADAQWQSEFDEALRQYNQNFVYQQSRDAVADSQWQSEFDEDTRRYNQDFAYQQSRDSVADSQWEKEFNEAVRQYNSDYALSKQQLESASALDSSSSPYFAKMSTDEMNATLESLQEQGDNDGLALFLDELVAAGRISSSQADTYYAKYLSKEHGGSGGKF